MGRVEHQLDMLRGQMEELAGRLELATAPVRSRGDLRRWLSMQFHGRMLAARGRGRRALASTRMRARQVAETLPEQVRPMGPYAAVGAVVLGVLALAIFAPNVLTSAWDRVARLYERTRGPMAAQTATR